MKEGPIIQANAVMLLRARHLTADGRDSESEQANIARQRLSCRDAATQLEAVVVREYVEYGGTGPIVHRPIVRRMLNDLHTLLGIRYVLVVGVDRLARTPEVLREIDQEIQATGARFLDVSGLPMAYRCNPDEAGCSLSGPLD